MQIIHVALHGGVESRSYPLKAPQRDPPAWATAAPSRPCGGTSVQPLPDNAVSQMRCVDVRHKKNYSRVTVFHNENSVRSTRLIEHVVINSPINMKVKCLEDAMQILRNEIKMFQLEPGVRYQKTRVFDRDAQVEQCTQGTKVPRSKASTKNSGFKSLL
ncbi:hypothetical protein TIFTF001_022300 [Ficus carica]|uniref:Uncharacterized protein n=1 Tax=Ficus carica TaxID=3494 RepID=A0AA88DEE4_FICCA|nr:hypothetical protein TIFTF001_022300 [Ficus carica]